MINIVDPQTTDGDGRDYLYFSECVIHLLGEVKVGNDQERAQSEKDSHSKNRGGKK